MDEDEAEERLREHIVSIVDSSREMFSRMMDDRAASVFEEVDRNLQRAFRLRQQLRSSRLSMPFTRLTGPDAEEDDIEDEDPPIVLRTRRKERQVDEQFIARRIPEVAALPQYKSWGYLLQNAQAQEIGRRQFYTDAPTGETIPASDDEAECQLGDELMTGPHWEREDFVLLELSKAIPMTPYNLALVAEVLDASYENVDARMREAVRLAEGRPGAAEAGAERASRRTLTEVLDNFQNAFCRRCRVFSCVKHRDGTPPPRDAEAGSSLEPSSMPCGPMCWRLKGPRAAPPSGLPTSLDPAPPTPPSAPPCLATEQGTAQPRPGQEAGVPPQPSVAQAQEPPTAAARAPSSFSHVTATLGTGSGGPVPLQDSTASLPVGQPGSATLGRPGSGPLGNPGPATTSGPPRAVTLGGKPPAFPAGLGLGLPGKKRPFSHQPVREGGEGSHHAVEEGGGRRPPANPAGAHAKGLLPLGLGGLTLVPPRKKRHVELPAVEGSPSPVPPAVLSAVTAGPSGPGASEGKQQGPAASPSPMGEPPGTDAEMIPALEKQPSQSLKAFPKLPKPGRLMPVRQIRGPWFRPPSTTDAMTPPHGATQEAARDWSDLEVGLLKKGAQMFGRDPCRIARLVGGRICAEVSAHLQRFPSISNSQPIAEEAIDAAYVPKKKGVKKMASKLVWRRRQGDQHDLWSEYQPCKCKGMCNESCPCFEDKNYCDKFCGCSSRCTLRFPGCRCTSGCKTKTCPCLAAGRECDPDLCLSCCIWGDAGADGISTPSRICTNMCMLLRQHKRIAVGLSEVSGWGAFVLEDVQKNELVGEYTGELIGHDEAERRGKAYDRDNNSYLFNLNSGLVIDARQRGNKLRYANHGDDANCRAEILMVDGDHRVGIYAVKDIPRCSELTYNYHYDRLKDPPHWVKKRKKLSEWGQDVGPTAKSAGK